MNLAMVNEATIIMKERDHSFTAWETEFVVQYAFKSGDKESTNKLIDELIESRDDIESQEIIQRYSSMINTEQNRVEEIENLLVTLELYRLEEEKAMNRLTDILRAHGIDVTLEEIQKSDLEELKKIVQSAEVSKGVC
jgi:flavorubredoxin